MHTKDAKNKKIKIFKFSLALYQILFRMYSGPCKKNLVLVGSKCTILEVIITTTKKGQAMNLCDLDFQGQPLKSRDFFKHF